MKSKTQGNEMHIDDVDVDVESDLDVDDKERLVEVDVLGEHHHSEKGILTL